MHDDTAPATKGDVRALKGDVRALEQSMNAQFERIDARFRRVHEDIDRVLNVLINLEKRIGGTLENHKQRIIHLETTVA